jgi:hypothetical protein
MGSLRLGRKPFTCEENRPVQTQRNVFFLANVVVFLIWLRFVVRLIEQWKLMKPDIRETLGAFVVLFCLLWLTMIREKKGYLSLAMACGILAAVYRIAWVLM